MSDLTESIRRRELVERIEYLTARVQRVEAALREAREWIGWAPEQSVKGIRQLGKAVRLVDKIDAILAEVPK